jgi:peroxiredoxin
VLLLLFAVQLQAIEIKLSDSDSTLDVRSVRVKGADFLALEDVRLKLPVSVKDDTAAGLVVLCSERNTIPVFRMDEQEFVQKDRTDYIKAELVAEAMGCTIGREKKTLLFTPSSGSLSRSVVGSNEGDIAPGFRLLKSDSTILSSHDLLKSGPLVVVFFRSAEWDPASKRQLSQLETKLDSIRAIGASLVAIHGYRLKESRKWERELKLHFPLLPDQSAAVMRAFNAFDRGNLPNPAVIVIAPSGKILLRDVHTDYTQFTDPGMILEVLSRIR